MRRVAYSKVNERLSIHGKHRKSLPETFLLGTETQFYQSLMYVKYNDFKVSKLYFAHIGLPTSTEVFLVIIRHVKMWLVL